MNDTEDEFVFFSVICIFSRRKLARIAHYFEITVPRYHCDGFRSHFRMTSSTFELLAQLLQVSISQREMYLAGGPLKQESR